jgi:hypothetical protein
MSLVPTQLILTSSSGNQFSIVQSNTASKDLNISSQGTVFVNAPLSVKSESGILSQGDVQSNNYSLNTVGSSISSVESSITTLSSSVSTLQSSVSTLQSQVANLISVINTAFSLTLS